MNIYKYLTAFMLMLFIIEVIVFNFWLYTTKKDSVLIDKYLWGVFNKKDIVGLSKGQTIFAQIIYVTRMLVIFFMCMQIFSIILLGQIRIT